MIRSKKIIVWLLLFSFVASPVYAVDTKEQDNARYNMLYLLNVVRMSMNVVLNNPNKIIIEREYNALVNNIAFDAIDADSNIKELISQVMDFYTSERLSDLERNKIKRAYERKINLIFARLKTQGDMTKEVAYASGPRLLGSLLTLNFFAAGWELLSGGSQFMLSSVEGDREERKANAEANEAEGQKWEEELRLSTDKIKALNVLQKKLLDASWTLVQKYKLPDANRLNDDNIKAFFDFITDKDVVRALRKASRMETAFSLYPPFWYYYGLAAQQAGDIAKARACFEKAESVARPIFRIDSYRALTAKAKIYILSPDEVDECKRLLAIVVQHSASSAWENILFAAVQYQLLGEKKKAEELLQQNIDNQHTIALHEKMLAMVKSGTFDVNELQGVAVRQFSRPSELEQLAGQGAAEAQFLVASQRASILDSSLNDTVVPLLQQAAAQDHFYARCLLAGMAHNSDARVSLKKELTVRVSHGEDQALLFLGYFALWDRDEKTAFQWFKKAGDKKYARAQAWLGMCYTLGLGTPKDTKKAFESFRRAAEQGDAYAYYNLALAYESGSGTTKDIKKAAEIAQKAADLGDVTAWLTLGRYYEKGLGVSKNPQKAFTAYHMAAERGVAAAQVRLGSCFASGTGIPKDLQKAAEWYRRAAEQGDISGMMAFAMCFELGTGVAKNVEKAFEWYRKAAELGDATAQIRLAQGYERGEGVVQNTVQAADWYRKAAEQGNAQGQVALGLCYENGSGIQKDMQSAFAWFQKAADQGDPQGQLLSGLYYEKGFTVPQDNKKAAELYRKAAGQGNARAQAYLGVFFSKGTGVAKDDVKAAELFRKSAEQGDTIGQINLGVSYEHGSGVSKNVKKTVEWYRKAAEQGSVRGQIYLGLCYEQGIGVSTDERQAFHWFMKAAEQGDTWSQNKVGLCYDEGVGVFRDGKKAMEWYIKAAEQGYALAQLNLGASYEHGSGGSKDMQKAAEWYRKAAAHGNNEAELSLKRLGG